MAQTSPRITNKVPRDTFPRIIEIIPAITTNPETELPSHLMLKNPRLFCSSIIINPPYIATLTL